MKTQFTTFALFALMLSGCGGETKMYRGGFTRVVKQGGVQISKLEDTGHAVFAYQNDPLSLTVSGLGADAITFDQKRGELILSEGVNDSTYESDVGSETVKYIAGTGMASGLNLRLDVTARVNWDKGLESGIQEFVWTYSGYLD